MELRDKEFAKQHQIRAMDNDEVIPFVSVDLILDHLGINFDGKNSGQYEESIVLLIEGNYHKVRVYKGTVLHEKVNITDIKDHKVIQLTKQELYQLAIKKYEGKEKRLLALQEYIVDTQQYKNFALIEPQNK